MERLIDSSARDRREPGDHGDRFSARSF